MKTSYAIFILLLLTMSLATLPSMSFSEELVLKLTGQLNESYQMGDHLFGFKTEALTGIDPLDTPEPPMPPAGYLSMAFTMNDTLFPTLTRWRNNFHNPADWIDRVEAWEMVFITDQPEEDCLVSLSLISGNQDHLQVRLIRGESVVELTLPGEFAIAAEDMGEIFVLEIFSDDDQISSISFEGLKCIFQ